MRSCKVLIALATAVPAFAFSADFAPDELCKAAISLEMARSSKTMHTVQQGDTPQIEYSRPDGEHFLYKCKVAGNRIIWSAYFTETRSWGRWRDGEWDAVITYRVDSETLHVSSSETGLTKSFTKADF